MTPRAAYRVQLHQGFTFADAARLAPYLAKLGISHLYVSPILAARPGSSHGYDVIDPTRVNPELGGEEGLCALVAALRQVCLGIIVDIVPNHMYAGTGNAWWHDVLRHGSESPYARYFDIDWEALGGKILLPILGKPYSAALSAGELKLDTTGAEPVIHYFDHALPVAPGEMPEPLHELLERQHYRLAWWRAAPDEINWRRFFDINELIAVRVEDPIVFEATHAALFRLYADGLIDGIRVDHIDGLADPGGYCRTLRARLAALDCARPKSAPPGPAYIVVEKIVGRGERLPRHWQTDGAVGYDFMNEASAVLHDPAGEASLTRLWTEISGRSGIFAEEETRARRETLARSFTAPFENLVSGLYGMAQADLATRDFSRAALRRCLDELLANFRVYRTYPDAEENNSAFFESALAAARQTCFPGDREVLEGLPGLLRSSPRIQTRLQQLTAPLAAKSVEDTAFYRYGRLLSRNDVGFDAGCFAATPDRFHRAMQDRLPSFPHGLLETATHDHKRGEDVRARLAVLSEVPDEWADVVRTCLSANRAIHETVDNRPAPSAGDEYMLYQTIVGSWPAELTLHDRAGCDAYRQRLAVWQRKAAREAKLETDWIAPDTAYEEAAGRFLKRLFEASGEGLQALAQFAHRIDAAGAVNGLTQTMLKLTAPGVPDFYQGSDFWDLSLVDPDNRRPVDFASREAALDTMPSPVQCASTWRDGRVKQAIIARVLATRRDVPALFADGDYRPLAATGIAAKHIVAFTRRHGDTAALVVVTRLAAALLAPGDGVAPIAEAFLTLPQELTGVDLDDVLGGGTVHATPEMPVGCLLGKLPVGLFILRHRTS